MIVRQSTQTLLTRVPETTMEEFDQAVDAASQAFKSWSKQSVLARQRFAIESVFEYPSLLTPDPLTLYPDFSIKSVRMQTHLPTASSSSRERPLPVRILLDLLVSSLITPQMLTVMSSVVFKSSKLPSLSRLTLSARN
jgi:hypothetical protein